MTDTHCFFITKSKNFKTDINIKNAIYLPCGLSNIKIALLKSKLCRDYDKVIVHYLHISDIVLLLISNHVLKKTCWIMWGGDLYKNNSASNKFKNYLLEYLKKLIIPKIPHIGYLVKGDMDYAMLNYNARARFDRAIYSMVVNFDMLDSAMKHGLKPRKETRILLGNSADPSNNHIEILNYLSQYRESNIEILCPLSYGEEIYAKQVSSYGKNMFNEKFLPLFEYMKPENYAKLLGTIDIGIMNHKRQQGLGNIYALLYLGKKVYIRSDTNHYHDLKQHGIVLFDTLDWRKYEPANLTTLEAEYIKRNRDIISYECSDDNIIKIWRTIFT